MLLSIFAILFGVFLIVFGGYDDSPGAQLLGLAVVVGGTVGIIKNRKKAADKTDKNYCSLHIVRHGETEWNAKGLMQGHKDSPLTELGIKQIQETNKKIKNIKFDAIYSSDLARAVRTAEILRVEKKLAIQTSKLLRERSYGRFEGRKSSEIRAKITELLEKSGDLSEENRRKLKPDKSAESDDEAAARYITYLREIAVAHPNQDVLVIGHGGTLRLLLIHLGYATREQMPKGSISNAAYLHLLSDGVDFFIKKTDGINKTTHGSN